MQHNQKTTVRKLYRLSYALGVLFLAMGMLLTTVGQPVFASVVASVNQIDADWDKSTLSFDQGYGCQGDCQEVRARVCNVGAAMEGTTTYNVYYHLTDNPKTGVNIYTGTIPQLGAGQCTILTYNPADNPRPEGPTGNYMFQFVQRPGHPGVGVGWSDQCTITSCQVPTATFTATATKTATFTPTATNTATFTPTATNTATFTPTATYTATFTPTATNTATYTPTATNTATFTPTSTFTATFTPTSTFTATFTPTSTFTATWTPVPPTATPTNTLEPTPTDTVEPTPTNTVEPTPTEVVPTPTEVVPTPTEVVPTPTEVVPTPTEVVPTPTEVVPTPTEVVPTPTEVVPTPTEVVPTPTPVETQPEPTPTSVEPTPTVVVSETPIGPTPTPGETEPPTDPTPLPTLPPPPRSTPSVLIPVTGADNSASFPLDGKLFTNIGLMFLGLAFVTQGLSRRNK